LDVAQQEYDELQTQRAEIDARLARLRETLVSLAYLVNEDGQTESLDATGLGLTEAVAKVLRLSGMALTPANIRDELARMGFDIKRYKSIIPTIVKVLARLHEKGHVDATRGEQSEKTLYIWSPMQPGIFTWTDDDGVPVISNEPKSTAADRSLAEAIRRRDAGEHLTPRMRRKLKAAGEEV
jgi:hypothetical protein